MKTPLMIAALAAVTFQAGPAQALSCMPSDVARSFLQADASDTRYGAFLGQFTFTPPPQVEPVDINNPVEHVIEAVFSGKGLTADGFKRMTDRPVTLVFQCFAAWCGGLSPDHNAVLGFVEMGEDGDVFKVDPCRTWVFQNPHAETIARAEACMAGGPCADAVDFN